LDAETKKWERKTRWLFPTSGGTSNTEGDRCDFPEIPPIEKTKAKKNGGGKNNIDKGKHGPRGELVGKKT